MGTQWRLLITGGTGFIGRYAIQTALGSGYHVLNIDLEEPESAWRIAETVVADVRDKDRMYQLFRDFAPTHVLHLASETDISISRVEDFSTIIGGSENVFAAAAAQPSVQRFVHVSTQYVLEPGLTPRGEQHYKPYTAYGAAKAESERRLWESDLRNWTIVRPCIVWGPHFETFADGLLKYIDRRLYRHPASRGPVLRTYGYVENVAEQMVRILGVPTAELANSVYYLGDMVIDYGDWADAFARALTGKDARRIPKSGLLALGAAGEVARRLGIEFPYNMGRYHRMTTASPLDLGPILSAVGPPQVDFETGIQRTVAWLRQYWGSEFTPIREQ